MKKQVFGFSTETILAPGNPWHTHPLDYPEVLGLFTALGSIAKHFGGSAVYIFAQVCQEALLPRRVEQGNLVGWFAFHRLRERTGILLSHVLFCRHGDEPALCRERKISCFVGTELSVLDSLSSVARRFFFFSFGQVKPRLKQHPGIELVASGSELIRQLRLPEEEEDSGTPWASPGEFFSVKVGEGESHVSPVALMGEEG